MSGFDYSKWDRLEISDDETTFHPNLDTGLNIRVNRITRDRKEEEIDSEKKKLVEKGELDKAEKLESKRPLHVNNVCHVAEERTIIQSSDGSRKDKLKKGEESFSVDEYSLFKQDNKPILDKFANADWELSEALCKDFKNGRHLEPALEARSPEFPTVEVMGATSSVERFLSAAAAGDTEELDRLLEQNPDINALDSRGKTAMMEAADKGHEECLRHLILHGADLNIRDNRGWSASMHAAFRGHVTCLELLIESGAQVDPEDFLGTTPLMRAAISGHVSCVRLLVQSGASLTKKDKLGLKAKAHARRKGHTPCVRLLNEEVAWVC
eukprot:symbB.v1.2.021516.t1/scaffold1859.1/size98302/2